MGANGSPPLISVVLPTYNREKLLPIAIESVLAQDYPHWDLIVVNDNSTDNTPDVIEKYCHRDFRIRSVVNDRYAHCCGGARNRGIDEVRGEYVAFLDSDDSWPSYHLSELLGHLLRNPDVDWVFADLQRVDVRGTVVVASKFREEWRERDHFPRDLRGDLFVLRRDTLLETVLQYNLPASLQTSLLRAEVFKQVRIRPVYTDDSLFAVEAAAAGFTFAYVEKCHLRYLMHGDNLSGANREADFDHRLRGMTATVRQIREYIPSCIPMTATRQRLLRKALADYYVWTMANGLFRAAGKRWAALQHILMGIVLCPWRWRYWKTLVATAVVG